MPPAAGDGRRYLSDILCELKDFWSMNGPRGLIGPAKKRAMKSRRKTEGPMMQAKNRSYDGLTVTDGSDG